MKTQSLSKAAAGLALMLSACTTDSDSGPDEFVEVIPGSQTLHIALSEDDDGASAQALSTDPSTFRERAKEVVDAVNEALRITHARIEALVEGVEPTERTLGEATCKVWEASSEEVDYRLRSCSIERRAKRFSFFLEGRPSGADGEYLPIVGGRGVALPRFEGERRGVGNIAYNFDNLRSLTGDGPQGRVGVGYRHAGRARQLHIGLLDFQRADSDQVLNARWSFLHVRGRGGILRLARAGDFLTRDENDELVSGTDGLEERGRVALAWNHTGAARVVAGACGGTVGEAQCVRVVQCYDASGVASYEEVGSEGAAITWEPTACPEVPVDIGAPPPTSDDRAPEGPSGELPGPSMEEPEPLPDFE